jgi:hypothetical protein
MNRNTTKQGDSESGDHHSGDDPSSKGGPANGLRIMTMEELEETEPGFAIRFDGEWERIFKRFRTSDQRQRKTKSKKFGKKVGP